MFISILDILREIALIPDRGIDRDFEQANRTQGVEPFVAALELLEGIAIANAGEENELPPEYSVEEFLAILGYIKEVMLDANIDLKKFEFLSDDPDAVQRVDAVLYLIEDVMAYIYSKVVDSEAFVRVLDEIRNVAIATGGDWAQLDIQESDFETFTAISELIDDLIVDIEGDEPVYMWSAALQSWKAHLE